MIFILDASVAIKWAMPSAGEPFTQEAVSLLRRYVNDEIEFIVPDIFWAEIGSVLWRGVKQQRWHKSKAEAVVADMQAFEFQTVSSQGLLNEAFKIALAYDRNIYDCFYVALAVEAEAELVTADERLANALAARYPVKWLGAV